MSSRTRAWRVHFGSQQFELLAKDIQEHHRRLLAFARLGRWMTIAEKRAFVDRVEDRKSFANPAPYKVEIDVLGCNY